MRHGIYLLVLAATLGLAGCSAGPSYASYGGNYGYYGGYNAYSTETSNCGAIGTCAPSGYPSVGVGDSHGD